MDNKKYTDEDILLEINEKMKTNYYTFGAYTDYNDLDVKNIKNQIVEAIKNNK